jgi:hypothetical protein
VHRALQTKGREPSDILALLAKLADVGRHDESPTASMNGRADLPRNGVMSGGRQGERSDQRLFNVASKLLR